MDGPTRHPIPQDANMVDKRCGPLIRCLVQLNENALDLLKVALEGIQEAPCLKVLGRGAATRDNCVSQSPDAQGVLPRTSRSRPP